MEARNRAFQQLKPVCVKLSESALKLMGKGGNIKEVTENLSHLQVVLTSVASQQDALDTKLAEYAFFPLSTVLKQLENIPLRTREITVECILILLQSAWSSQIAPELGMQLMILYSFLADQKGSKSSEEFKETVFKSLTIVLSSLGDNEQGRQSLVSAKTIPHLGKTVSVILDAIHDGPTEAVQSAAVAALDSFCRAIPDRDALGISFLPGIMSCLTKVLTPKAARTSSKVLTASLNVLAYLLPHLFRDGIVKALPEGDKALEQTQKRTKSWLRATTSQIKMALANIIKAQQSDRQNVRISLWKFCSVLLAECSAAFAESTSMLLETAVTLAGQEPSVESELRGLLTIHQGFSESLRSSLHYWIMSLPRVMESADDIRKQRRIHQITLSFGLLVEQGLDMRIIDADLATNLRDSVVSAIKEPENTRRVTAFDIQPASVNLIRNNGTPNSDFDQILVPRKAQQDTMKELSALAQQLGTNETALVTAQSLVGTLNFQRGDQQLGSFWLALNMIRSALNSDSNIDSFLSFENEATDIKTDLLEQIYDFSISALSDTSLASEKDWRIHALALETVALQASQQKEDFRNELVDALYPVLHFMGSSIPALRDHAITCLNILAEQCGYSDTGELIVANVDYLVNAVALRLNTFDISPQAPQVLLMMVKLSGPSLLPYLDDTVDSIFLALESFHGYPKLVDLLFSVLKVIVEEGTKTTQLAITSEQQKVHKKPLKQGTTIDELVSLIHDIRERYSRQQDEELPGEPFPEQSWKNEEVGSEEEGSRNGQEKTDELPPPAPRTYSLLLNISRLTQHYLTSSSPELRTSLLKLLSASFPALAKHENSFLPLINTLWPVLLPRLEDPEPYVVSGSLDIIGTMCRNAGDFMSGRIEEAWPQIRKLFRTRTGRAGNPTITGQRRVTSSTNISNIVTTGTKDISRTALEPLYVDAPSRIIWEALVGMLVDILTHTATNNTLYDEILEILTPVINSRPDVREALESINADAVWFALWRLESKGSDTHEQKTLTVTQTTEPIADFTWQFAEL